MPDIGKRLVWPALLLAGLIVANAGVLPAAESPAGMVGKAAPDFALPDLSGKTVRFSETRGKPVLLEFWATWCKDCREVLPHLDRVYREYGPKGLAVVTVSVDTKQDAVKPFLEKHGYAFPVLLDDGKMRERYAVQRIPTLYLIDRKGTVRTFFVEYGEKGRERLDAELKKLMAE